MTQSEDKFDGTLELYPLDEENIGEYLGALAADYETLMSRLGKHAALYISIDKCINSEEGQRSKNMLIKATQLKRSSDFEGALALIKEVISRTPLIAEAHYNAGKIYYLLENPSLSMREYLIAAHFSIAYQATEKLLIPAISDSFKSRFGLPVNVRTLIATYPEEAVYLAGDTSIPRHYAHSAIDFDTNKRTSYLRGWEYYPRKYKASIVGNSNDEQNEHLETNVYFVYGIKEMLKLIKWDKLDFTKPYELY